MTNTGVSPKTYVKGSITVPMWISTYDNNYNTFSFGDPVEKIICDIDGYYASLSELL